MPPNPATTQPARDDILAKAVVTATKLRKYNSETARLQITSEFAKRTRGKTPYGWQVDVAEALLLGLDCTVIAGTGAGKTMPFVMPLFVEPKKVVIIISPLNALEEDQASRFRDMKLTAAAVNGETYSDSLHKDIAAGRVQVLVTSPEMCIEHDRFRQLLSSNTFASRVCCIVVDEAHCISQWGDEFRPVYAKIGALRAFVPSRVPFLAVSATMPAHVLSHVRSTLHINEENSYHTHLGVDRRNIAWFVRRMEGGKKDLESLDFTVPLEDPAMLAQSLVFFDEINVAIDALDHLRNRLGQRGDRDLLQVYHSRRSPRAKVRLLESFRQGAIKMLLSTEAAGMGCDIPDIELVVQFMVPSSLSTWVQRAGRAGRNPNINSNAVLLVQPSVFQEAKAASRKENKGGEEETKYRKEVEPGLRRWIETEECRQSEAAVYFDDTRERHAPTGDCCDNCLRIAGERYHRLFQSHSTRDMAQEAHGGTLAQDVDNNELLDEMEDNRLESVVTDVLEPSTLPNGNGKRPLKVPNRRKEHLEAARDLVCKWRYETWEAEYKHRPWGTRAFMPDKLVGTIALHARLSSVDDLIKDGWNPVHAKRHGEELLNKLHSFDAKWYRQHEEAKLARRVAKKQATAEKNAMKAAEQKQRQAAARLLRQTAPKIPRPSRAKACTTPASVNITPALSTLHAVSASNMVSSNHSNKENIYPEPVPYLAFSTQSSHYTNMPLSVPVQSPSSLPMTPHHFISPPGFSQAHYASTFMPLPTSFFYSPRSPWPDN
ncbi:hypothetical protein AB1N83_011263 [Pleurotus pulmonarius]